MKTNLRKTYLLLGAILLNCILLLSCNPSDDNIEESNFASNFGSSVSKDFIGRVVDVNDNPISNVAIAIGSKTGLTDINGIFIINDANVYEKFAFITAKKPGYIGGSRSLIPTVGKNKVDIMLLSSAPTTTISSGVASEVSLTSGTKVNFDGAFQDESGATYSGTVQVALNELKPSNPNLNEIMPGMLFAESADGNAKVLETFGMMNVELKGSGGQKLQIASGHSAQITMDIDASQLATCPTTIPLWHFDEVNGYWKEDGIATKTGNKYIGIVSHFSWWNCDYPSQYANLIVNVTDTSGNPIFDVRVDIIQVGSIWPRTGYTNASGLVSGIVPAGFNLTLTVLDDCGNVMVTLPIGPFSPGTTTTLPTIVLSSIGTSNISTVTGNLVDCSLANVTNGYVILDDGNHISFANVTSGAFSFASLVCTTGAGFNLTGFDYNSSQTTGVLPFIYTFPTIFVGNISACTAVNEFISYQIDSSPVVNIIGSINASNNNHYIFANNPGTNEMAYIGLPLITPPTGFSYTTADNFSYIKDSAPFINIPNSAPNTITFYLSNYGAVGSFIDITISGTYDELGVTHTLNATVHVIRDN
jgi:hypothetical protein